MSARKASKHKGMTSLEKYQMLQDLFPEIAPDVVQLMLDSCDGEVDEAHNHLRELDLEIWAAKKSNPLVDLLPDSLAGEISCGEDLSFSRNGEMMILADSVGSSSYLPDRDYFSFGLSSESEANSSQPNSSTNMKLELGISPETEAELKDKSNWSEDWTKESSSDFASSDADSGKTGVKVYQNEHNTSTCGLQLTLDKDVAVKLMMTFGLMQVPIDCNQIENLLVNLDMEVAYKLYQAWKNTQESLVLQTAPQSAISEDEKLARCLQECEHEAYAEQSLKENSLRQIMDETYALSLAEKDSNGRGMDLPSALQYQSNGGVESKWVDVLLRSHNMSPDVGYPLLNSGPKNVHAAPIENLLVDQPTPRLQSSEVGPKAAKTIVVTPVSTRQSPGPASKLPFEQVDYFGARQEALQLQRKAVEYGARAGKAYADRKVGGGVAAYYLQKSHETKSLAKEAHLAASINILNTRNLNAGDGEIDLHGLRMDEVSLALDTFFEKRHTVKEIKIISGRGLHSRTGSSEVRRAVAIYLNKYGFKFEEGPPEGVFYVQKWQKSKLKAP